MHDGISRRDREGWECGSEGYCRADRENREGEMRFAV